MDEMVYTPGCCEERTTKRTEEEKKLLLNRLSRLEGQIRGIKKMVDEDAYCADLLTQTAAVSSALGSLECEIMTRHLKNCVANDLKNGRTESTEEMSKLLRKLLK